MVHDDRRTLYVEMRPNREVACCQSAGFGDLFFFSFGDWSGRNESGEKQFREKDYVLLIRKIYQIEYWGTQLTDKQCCSN